MTRMLLALVLPLTIAACAGPQGDPPSLGTLMTEGIVDRPARDILPLTATVDPALAAAIDALVIKALTGDAAFAILIADTRAAIAAAQGATIESEQWVAAQLMLSALDHSRHPTSTALGELDMLYGDQALVGRPTETDRLLAARRRVRALDADQTARYAPLRAGLFSH